MTPHDRHRLHDASELLTSEEIDFLLMAVIAAGFEILRDAKGPMPLWQFSKDLAAKVGVRVVPDLTQLSDAIKALLWEANHPRLRLIATTMSGVGYVYDLKNAETWPVVK